MSWARPHLLKPWRLVATASGMFRSCRRRPAGRSSRNPAEGWTKFPIRELPKAARERLGASARKRKKVETVSVSDHAPVETQLEIDNPWTSHKDFVKEAKQGLKLAKQEVEAEQQERRERLGLTRKRKQTQWFRDEL
jgi:hypothetical protein